MSIVFDEIQGSVTPSTAPGADQRPSGTPERTPPPADPTSIARAMRLIKERKARLSAD